MSSNTHVNSNHNEPLELVCSNICSPMPTMSLGLEHYILPHSFMGIFSKTKDEVLSIFQRFKTLVEAQTGKKVNFLRSNNGG